MYSNSSRTVTAFSDLEHATDHVYLSNREVLDYLHRYAETFGLTSRIRLGTRVELISRDGAGWRVVHVGTDERFDRIVVATGRFHAPADSGRCRVSRRSPDPLEPSPPTTTGMGLRIGASGFWSRAARSARSKSPQN